MLLRLLIACAALTLTAPALAQLPAPLEAALAVTPGDVNAEGMIFRMALSGQSIRVAVDFGDEDGPVYRLIEPASQAQLSQQQAEMWAGFVQDDEADEPADEEPTEDGERYSVGFGDYDPEALRAAIGDTASLIETNQGLLTYAFTPQSLPGQGDTPDDMMEHMQGAVVINTNLNQLESIRFSLTESFKPNMAARLNEFVLEQRFVHEPALGGPRMAGVSMTMEGSAMFQTFTQTMQFDIEEARYPQDE